MKGREEIADNNFLLCREYFLREKELNFEKFQKNKSMWKGDALMTTRKSKPTEMPKSKKKYVKQSHRQYLNNKNKYKTFLPDDVKRLQILENYKEINRIITKNYIKKTDPALELMKEEDESINGFGAATKSENLKDPIIKVQQVMRKIANKGK
mmetsp:Transcript_19241/g.17060  ORF Transcript_19241/g.17060 Transcript_19241/m.17060 type:complete len:153 (-) Transcript_19241:69-527(-)